MTKRERFIRTLRFETVDHPPLLPGGPWPTTLRRWRQEGLPPGADLEEALGIEPTVVSSVAIETLLFPPFEEKILEEAGEYIIKMDKYGVKVRNFRDETSMAEHLEYSIHGPEDLEWLIGRLNPDAPGRARPDWLTTALKQLDDAGIEAYVAVRRDENHTQRRYEYRPQKEGSPRRSQTRGSWT